MAGYVIHLAVAESYIKKHEDDIKDYNRFIEGVIFPDSISDKSITHYGEKSSKTDLKAFLEDNKIDNDYSQIGIWGGLLSIIFLIFGFFAIFKIEETKTEATAE